MARQLHLALLSALSVLTSRVGLGATISTRYHQARNQPVSLTTTPGGASP